MKMTGNCTLLRTGLDIFYLEGSNLIKWNYVPIYYQFKDLRRISMTKILFLFWTNPLPKVGGCIHFFRICCVF